MQEEKNSPISIKAIGDKAHIKAISAEQKESEQKIINDIVESITKNEKEETAVNKISMRREMKQWNKESCCNLY